MHTYKSQGACPELLLHPEIDMACIKTDLGGLFGLDKQHVDNEVLNSVNHMIPNCQPYLRDSFLNDYNQLYDDYIPDFMYDGHGAHDEHAHAHDAHGAHVEHTHETKKTATPKKNTIPTVSTKLPLEYEDCTYDQLPMADAINPFDTDAINPFDTGEIPPFDTEFDQCENHMLVVPPSPLIHQQKLPDQLGMPILSPSSYAVVHTAGHASEPMPPVPVAFTPVNNMYGFGKSQKKITDTPDTITTKRKDAMCPTQDNFEVRKAMRTTIESIQKGIREGPNNCNKSLSSAIRNMSNTFNVEQGVPLSLMLPPRKGYRCVVCKGKTLQWVSVVCSTADTIVVEVEHNSDPMKAKQQWIFRFDDGEWGNDNCTLII